MDHLMKVAALLVIELYFPHATEQDGDLHRQTTEEAAPFYLTSGFP
jgi:hypothetical protein